MRKYVLPALIAGVAIAFATVCLLVWLTRGRGPGLGAKLRLGGLLLTMTGVVMTGCSDGEIACYSPALGDYFSIDGQTNAIPLPVDLRVTNILHGTIDGRFINNTNYSWSLADQTTTLASNTIFPADGSFDQATERFAITLPGDLPSGLYSLRLFTCPVTNQAQSSFRRELSVQVTNTN